MHSGSTKPRDNYKVIKVILAVALLALSIVKFLINVITAIRPSDTNHATISKWQKILASVHDLIQAIYAFVC